MRLRDLRLKLKAFRLRRFVFGISRKKRSQFSVNNNRSWLTPVTHGYHVVKDDSYRSVLDADESDDNDSDSVVVQREQMEELELWFFGVFNSQMIGDKVIKFMQTHFFDKRFIKSQIKRKGKETMKKAHLNARARIGDDQKMEDNELWTVGSASSALVIDGDKLVIASMGDYRAVVCEDGFAHQISCYQHPTKFSWPSRFISGVKGGRSSELVVAYEKINSETEFVILASNGIWEVMKNQEAVNLIRHMEDPQEAAQCLAKEAVTRMSKSSISCLIIRFD